MDRSFQEYSETKERTSISR